MKISIVSLLFPALGFCGTPIALAGWLLIGFARLASLCGALYWSVPLVGLFVPITSIVLFLANPVGVQAWGYALFWLLPLHVWVSDTRSIIARAYASTFVAHAVGSVLFLYSHATVPAYWWGLMPRVVVERTIFAATLVLLYKFWSKAWSTISRFKWTAIAVGQKSKA